MLLWLNKQHCDLMLELFTGSLGPGPGGSVVCKLVEDLHGRQYRWLGSYSPVSVSKWTLRGRDMLSTAQVCWILVLPPTQLVLCP